MAGIRDLPGSRVRERSRRVQQRWCLWRWFMRESEYVS